MSIFIFISFHIFQNFQNKIGEGKGIVTEITL